MNAKIAIAAGAALAVKGDGAAVALDPVIGALKQDTRVIAATGSTDAVERNRAHRIGDDHAGKADATVKTAVDAADAVDRNGAAVAGNLPITVNAVAVPVTRATLTVHRNVAADCLDPAIALEGDPSSDNATGAAAPIEFDAARSGGGDACIHVQAVIAADNRAGALVGA